VKDVFGKGCLEAGLTAEFGGEATKEAEVVDGRLVGVGCEEGLDLVEDRWGYDD